VSSGPGWAWSGRCGERADAGEDLVEQFVARWHAQDTGGAIALELGRDGVELRAIGTVNGLITGRPGEAARIRCPVWAGVGSEDPIMPPA
jgi:hypothetical protein